MKFLLEFEVKDTIVTPEQIASVRQLAGPLFQQILTDPRISGSGHMVSGRKGFMLMEAGKAEEIMELIGPLLDALDFRIEPYVGFDTLLDFFKKG